MLSRSSGRYCCIILARLFHHHWHSPPESLPLLLLLLLFWLLLSWGLYGSRFSMCSLPPALEPCSPHKEGRGRGINLLGWVIDADRNWGGSSLSSDHKYWDINSFDCFCSVLMGYQASLLQPFQFHLLFPFSPSILKHVEEEGHPCLESFVAASISLSFLSLFV